ncbi:MAG: hypothetical protein HY238_09415 [Acidobacteria bacterium]|nr:hypothetical protein [Acidobacteriota bacterium]
MAGAAALLKGARTGLSVAQYRSLLINSAAPVAFAGGQPSASAAGRGRSAGRERRVIFRVTDLSGIPVTNTAPNISVVSGGGEPLDVSSVDDPIPGAYSLTVRLGVQAGSNVFRIQAGELSKEVTITGR